MQPRSSRRKFLRGTLAASSSGGPLAAQSPGRIRGFDHVALPTQNTEAMLAFYRGLGLQVTETPNACSVYIGDQMINFHRPALWQRETFTLRAPAARPAYGDLCFVWEGGPESLKAMLNRAGPKGHRRPGGPAGWPPPASTSGIRTATSWSS